MKSWEDDWQRELDKRTGDDGYATFSPDNAEDIRVVNEMFESMISEKRKKINNFIEKYGKVPVTEYLLHPEKFSFTEEEQQIIDSLLEGGL